MTDDCCGECLPEDTEDHACSPHNGGLGGGLRLFCRACGSPTPPMIPCTRPDCDHRIIGG